MIKAFRLRICFKFISSLAERCFRVDLRCQGAANSGLFARIERAKMPKRPTDKPKSRFKNRLAIILKQILMFRQTILSQILDFLIIASKIHIDISGASALLCGNTFAMRPIGWIRAVWQNCQSLLMDLLQPFVRKIRAVCLTKAAFVYNSSGYAWGTLII